MVNLSKFNEEMATSFVSDDEDLISAGAGGGGVKPLPHLPPNQGPPTVPLFVLLDFAVQKTYHELIVLSELLPKKSDQDRKISIVQFAHSTRQLFIRLLALVKWVKVSGKVNENCTAISYLLEQQASYFVETADRLVELARGELTNARLPAFQIPAAVDVLTLGSYPRLPVCIKSRFVPDDSITDRERACVLQRLNQVIQYKLYSTARPLPNRMRQVNIKNGMATFLVPGEFEASLTLLGELPDIPWTLLHLKILVEDFVVGDGSELVHPLQLHYLHQVVQNRLNAAADRAIGELYTIVHSFCLSVQIDVLYCQSMTLIHDRLHGHMSIDAYRTGKKLVLSYWRQTVRQPSASAGRLAQKSSTSLPSVHYQISIETENDGLKFRHFPVSEEPLPDCLGGQQAELSIEKLITETATVRSRQRLRQLKRNLEKSTALKCAETGTTVAELTAPIVMPSDKEEWLCVTVNVFSGRYVCIVPALGVSKRLKEVEIAMNAGNFAAVSANLAALRMELVEKRCRQGVAHLPVRVVNGVPLSKTRNAQLLAVVPKHRMYMQFTRYDNFYIVLGFRSEKDGISVEYYLLSTSAVDMGAFPLKNQNVSPSKAVSLVQIDLRHVFNAYKQIITKDVRNLNENLPERKIGEKWRSCDGEECELPEKIRRISDELAVTISVCDQRIPFFLLSGELSKRGVMHQNCILEGAIGGMLLRIIRLPRSLSDPVDSQTPSVQSRFSVLPACLVTMASVMWQHVLACNIRLAHDPLKAGLQWNFEVVFVDPPLIGVGQKAETDSKGVVFQKPVSEENARKSVDEFLNAVCAFSRLYLPVKEFAKVFAAKMSEYIQVKMFSYHRLVLGYGPDFGYSVTIQWRHGENMFHLSFGIQGNKITGSNPHTVLAPRLKQAFNEAPNIAWLAQTLHDTINPLIALRGLKEDPVVEETAAPSTQQQQGSNVNTVYSVGIRWGILAVSECTVRVLFRGQIILEVMCLAGGVVAVRDAAASISTERVVAGSFLPAPGLRQFLEKFGEAEGDGENKTEGRLKTEPVEAKEAPTSVGSFMHLTSPGSVDSNMPGSVPPPPPTGTQLSQGGSGSQAPPSVPGAFGPMTPSPAPPMSNAPLLTPSPAPPMSISAMVMTPSPAMITQPSPAPAQPHGAPKFTESGNRKEIFANPKPVLMKHSAFEKMCKPKEGGVSPLENFLSALITLKAYEKGCEMPNPLIKPGLFAFSHKGVDFEFYLDPWWEWPLRLSLRMSGCETYTVDNIPVIEEYFAKKVGVTNSWNAIGTFVKIMGLTYKEVGSVARSFVSMMKHELNPDLSLRYRVSLCLLTPAAHNVVLHNNALNKPAGTSAFRMNNNQTAILFYVQLIPNDPSRTRKLAAFPLIYKMDKNTVSFAAGKEIPTQLDPARQILDRQNANCDRVKDCPIWPAMRDLCENLDLREQ